MGIKPVTKSDFAELTSGVFLAATFAIWAFFEYADYQSNIVAEYAEKEQTAKTQDMIQNKLRNLTHKIQRLENTEKDK